MCFGDIENHLSFNVDPNNSELSNDDFTYEQRVELGQFASPVELDLYLIEKLDKVIDEIIMNNTCFSKLLNQVRTVLDSYEDIGIIDQGGFYHYKEYEKYYIVDRKYYNRREVMLRKNLIHNDPISANDKPIDTIVNWYKNVYCYLIVSHLKDFERIVVERKGSPTALTKFGFQLREDKFSVLRDVYLALIKEKAIESEYKYLSFKRVFAEQFNGVKIDWILSQKALKYFINKCIAKKIINKPHHKYELIVNCFTVKGNSLNAKSLESSKKPIATERIIIDSIIDQFLDS